MNITSVKFTVEDLHELQQDLEDAATDYGAELSQLTVEEAVTNIKTVSYVRAEKNFQKASEKLRRALEIFMNQN